MNDMERMAYMHLKDLLAEAISLARSFSGEGEPVNFVHHDRLRAVVGSFHNFDTQLSAPDPLAVFNQGLEHCTTALESANRVLADRWEEPLCLADPTSDGIRCVVHDCVPDWIECTGWLCPDGGFLDQKDAGPAIRRHIAADRNKNSDVRRLAYFIRKLLTAEDTNPLVVLRDHAPPFPSTKDIL